MTRTIKEIPIAVERMIKKKSLHELESKGLKDLVSKKSYDLHNMSIDGLELDVSTPRCNRARLDTGPYCNYDCEFCYYKDILHVKIPFDIVKGRIDFLKSYGITEVDLSGGESSVSPDWFEILDYCNDKFDSISCLSHGGKFADIDFLRESRDRGLKEILFSLHGATEEVHDAITDRKGSFKRILKAIDNAKELGMIVRTNATVYYRNTHQLENEYADLINRIMPLETNFLTLNYWGEHHKIDFENVSYRDMTDGIKKCIDRLNDGINIQVRYVPFCYMKGYEKYVRGVYQHIYDLRDWNRETSSYKLDVSREYNNEEKIQLAYEECSRDRYSFYEKELKCVTCKNFYVCDGIEKEIKGTELYPEPGEKIKRPMFYRDGK